jgi:hypothetical protein
LSDWKRKVTAEYEPTDAQHSLVESASAFGITQAEIAAQLKISEPTLRKHFRKTIREDGNWLNSIADHQALAGRKRRCDLTSTCDKPNSKPLDTPEKPNCQHLVVRPFRPRYK